MLEVNNLSLCHQGYRVIDNLSFSVPAGRILSVMGPSGIGKTTLINGLAGILKPSSGSLRFHGVPLRPDTVSIGLVPQNYGLLPWKTVKQNCLFYGAIRKIREPTRLHAILNRLNISPLADRYPKALSGGQAQRAALARVFYFRPSLLLLDEPFSALDADAAADARSLFLSLWEEYSPTAVLITHRIPDALYLSDQIAVMGEQGRFLLFCGNPCKGRKTPGADHLAEALENAIKEKLSLQKRS